MAMIQGKIKQVPILLALLNDNGDLRDAVNTKVRHIDAMSRISSGSKSMSFDSFSNMPVGVSRRHQIWTPSHLTTEHVVIDWVSKEDLDTGWIIGSDVSVSFIVVEKSLEVHWPFGSAVMLPGDMVNIRAGNRYLLRYPKGSCTTSLYYRDDACHQEPILNRAAKNLPQATL